MKHSPAPWRVVEAPAMNNQGWNLAVHAQSRAMAAVMFQDALPEDEQRANARLIENAPKLLDALRLVIELGEDPDADLNDMDVDYLRAVYKAATGTR